MEPEPFWYAAGAAGSGATYRANREAFDRWRIVPRMLTGATARAPADHRAGHDDPGAGAHRPGRRAGHHASRRRARGRPRQRRARPADDPVHRFVVPAGGGRRGQRRRHPLVPALLAQRRGRLRELPVPGQGGRLLRPGRHPRHLDARLAPARSRQRLPALPHRQGAGHLLHRPGLPRRAGEDARGRPAGGRAALAADVHRHRPHLGEPRASSATTGTARSCSRASSTPTTRAGPPTPAWTAIVVSNHGGRQVDGAIGSLDALPGIVDAVGDRLEVLFDSGVRTGADVLKAVALGAKATLVGRPWVYGLALGGYDGVRHVLRCLLADLDLALALSGNSSLADLGPHTLQPRDPPADLGAVVGGDGSGRPDRRLVDRRGPPAPGLRPGARDDQRAGPARGARALDHDPRSRGPGPGPRRHRPRPAGPATGEPRGPGHRRPGHGRGRGLRPARARLVGRAHRGRNRRVRGARPLAGHRRDAPTRRPAGRRPGRVRRRHARLARPARLGGRDAGERAARGGRALAHRRPGPVAAGRGARVTPARPARIAR